MKIRSHICVEGSLRRIAQCHTTKYATHTMIVSDDSLLVLINWLYGGLVHRSDVLNGDGYLFFGHVVHTFALCFFSRPLDVAGDVTRGLFTILGEFKCGIPYS